MKKLNFYLFLLLSCHSTDNKPVDPINKLDVELRDQMATYCELSKKRYEDKKVLNKGCDQLLFNSLHAIACGFPDIEPYQGEPGQWFRTPSHDCFIPPSTDNGAVSTISKDMYAGLLLYIAHYKRGDLARATYEYCQKNKVAGGLGCQVGKGINTEVELSRTILPPDTIQIIDDMVRKYDEGKNTTHGTTIKQFTVEKDYKAHLQVLRILLVSKVYGGISDLDVKLLREHCSRNPKNILFCGALKLHTDGDVEGLAIDLLSMFPKDRLPDTRDKCTHYLWQREQKNTWDWKPCPQNHEEYDGTDFLIAAKLLLGEL